MDMEIVTAVLGITGSSFKIMDTVSNLISKSINTRQERPPFNLNVRFQNERAKERYYCSITKSSFHYTII